MAKSNKKSVKKPSHDYTWYNKNRRRLPSDTYEKHWGNGLAKQTIHRNGKKITIQKYTNAPLGRPPTEKGARDHYNMLKKQFTEHGIERITHGKGGDKYPQKAVELRKNRSKPVRVSKHTSKPVVRSKGLVKPKSLKEQANILYKVIESNHETGRFGANRDLVEKIMTTKYHFSPIELEKAWEYLMDMGKAMRFA